MSVVVGAFKGAIWNAAGTWLQIAVNLAGVAIVARWVGPEGYGIVGAALLLIGFCRLLCAGALSECIVQRPDLHEGHIDVTFYTEAGLAVALAAITFAAAPHLCGLIGTPAAATPLRVLAVLLPLSALASVPSALLQRELKFRELAQIGTTTTLAANLAGIALAIGGAGLWSLVAMEAVRTLVWLAGSWYCAAWRPGLHGRWRHLRDLSRFNANVLATYALGHADNMLPRALIAVLLGPQALGQYLLARRVFDELTRVLTGPLSGIAMASTARAQSDRQAVQRIVLGLYETSALVALPAFLGLAVLAPLAVPLVFGGHWADAVPALQVLLLCGVRTATGVFNVSILRALGRADLPLALLGAGLLLTAVLVPAFASWGLTGVMLAVLLRTLATWPLGCWLVAKVTGIGVRRQLAAGAPALWSAAAMAAVLWALLTNGSAGLPPGVLLAVGTLSGAVIYVAVLALVSPRTVRRLRELASAVAGRDDRSLAAALGEPR